MIDYTMEQQKQNISSLNVMFDYNNYTNKTIINSTDLLSDTASIYTSQSSSSSSIDDTIISKAEEIGDYLLFYYPPILVLTGSLGNILSVIVFFKTKLKKLSSSYYLAALAVSDTCFLFGVFMQWLNFIDIYLYNREILCQFFTFFSNLCSFLSVWFVVAFTVERFIAVMYPLKRQSMCTVKRAIKVLIGLIILGSIHCIPCIFLAAPIYNEKINISICDVRPEYKFYMLIWNYLDTVIVFAIPFTTIVVLNTFTGCTVWKFANVRRSMTMPRRTSEITRTSFTQLTKIELRRQTSFSSNCAHPNRKNSIKRDCTSKFGRKKTANSSQVKVTKMLLIVSTVFVCLNLPSYVMRVRAFLESNSNGEVSKTTIVVQYICWFFFLTNFGINFVLYCISGQNFRKAVVSMFKKVSNQRDGMTQLTGNEVSDYSRNSGNNASRKRKVNVSNGTRNNSHELRQIISLK